MAKDYQQLWQGVTNASGEAKAVRILAEILTDKEGRTFISSLDAPRDVGLCVEILDRVGCHLDPSFVVSDGFSRAFKITTSGLQRNKASSMRSGDLPRVINGCRNP